MLVLAGFTPVVTVMRTHINVLSGIDLDHLHNLQSEELFIIKEIDQILFREDSILDQEGIVQDQGVQDQVVIDHSHVVVDRGPMDEVGPDHMDEGQDLEVTDHVLGQDLQKGIHEDHHIVDM